MLLVKKLDKRAKLPKVAHPNEDLGFDLMCLGEVIVPAKGFAGVNTGIAAQYKDALGGPCGMKVEGRSSLAMEGIFTMAGVLDSGYSGQIVVFLGNMSEEDKYFDVGDKIAQLVPHKELADEVKEVKEFPLDGNRGTKGFGSSN